MAELARHRWGWPVGFAFLLGILVGHASAPSIWVSEASYTNDVLPVERVGSHGADAVMLAPAQGSGVQEQCRASSTLHRGTPTTAVARGVATNSSRFRGGKHKDLDAVPGKIERHHVPADSVSTKSHRSGPAIEMDIEDHYKTASWGRSREAKAYRERQRELIGSGRIDDAIQMDIDDVIGQWPGKYDEAILEMIDTAL